MAMALSFCWSCSTASLLYFQEEQNHRRSSVCEMNAHFEMQTISFACFACQPPSPSPPSPTSSNITSSLTNPNTHTHTPVKQCSTSSRWRSQRSCSKKPDKPGCFHEKFFFFFNKKENKVSNKWCKAHMHKLHLLVRVIVMQYFGPW